MSAPSAARRTARDGARRPALCRDQVVLSGNLPRLFPAVPACYAAPVLRTAEADSSPRGSAASDDEQLVHAAANGDRDALGQLYDRFAPGMLAVAQRILGSAREAEDLVHDVFLEAWHHARHYDRSRGSVRTWLMLRVRSRSLDRLRSVQRAKVVDLDRAKLEHAPDASADSAAAPDCGTVRGVLAALPEEQRAVLELSYFAGYSCSEISARLEVPIGTVKSRMARGLTELRSRLGAQKGDQQ